MFDVLRICKHLVSACIKTSTNLPGLVFMPKVLVTRWRRKRPVYMSPIKRLETIEVPETTYISNGLIESVTQPCDIVSHKSKVGRSRKTNFNKLVVEKELGEDENLVTQKSKAGRPRKIGKALENDNLVEKTITIKKSVKRLVNYQPRIKKL